MEQRETIEQAISFAATLCVETARHQGRRIILGWTVRYPRRAARPQPRSSYCTKLLEQLAVMTPVSEGGPDELFDVMPPAALREALLVVISMCPINLVEEAERSVAILRHVGPRSAWSGDDVQRHPRRSRFALSVRRR